MILAWRGSDPADSDSIQYALSFDDKLERGIRQRLIVQLATGQPTRQQLTDSSFLYCPEPSSAAAPPPIAAHPSAGLSWPAAAAAANAAAAPPAAGP